MNSPLIVKEASAWVLEALQQKDPDELWAKTWYEGECCCLFADSNVGKSIYAVQIADYLSNTGKRVLYCDFELSAKQFQLRYTENEVSHPFSTKFLRAEFDISKDTGEAEKNVIDCIEETCRDNHVEVLIVDNITFLNSMTESASEASAVMRQLTRLKRDLQISILVLAHTPKLPPNTALDANNLAGSKRLFNFFDSAFSLGFVGEKSSDMRYFKQIKVRYGNFLFGANNCLCYKIEKAGAFLRFTPTGVMTENTIISNKQLAEISILKGAGKSIRQISELTGLSKSEVHRKLKLADEKTEILSKSI